MTETYNHGEVSVSDKNPPTLAKHEKLKIRFRGNHRITTLSEYK